MSDSEQCNNRVCFWTARNTVAVLGVAVIIIGAIVGSYISTLRVVTRLSTLVEVLDKRSEKSEKTQDKIKETITRVETMLITRKKNGYHYQEEQLASLSRGQLEGDIK